MRNDAPRAYLAGQALTAAASGLKRDVGLSSKGSSSCCSVRGTRLLAGILFVCSVFSGWLADVRVAASSVWSSQLAEANVMNKEKFAVTTTP